MAMQLLKEEYSSNNVGLRILTPMDSQIMHTIEELKKILSELDIRALNESTQKNRVIMVLADGKESLIVDIKDDTKDNMYEAAGLSIYSDNKSIVMAYLAMFEILWKQSRPPIC
jgi:endo-alpha-1,4-polygalactosaminidase (GH114 family)